MRQASQRSASASHEEQQPPRKKLRKGTRSCWECKHRKVRCHFISDGDQACRECLSRGTPCRSQDLPEPKNPNESDRASLNERLGRVESLLETVLQRLDRIGGEAEEARALPSVAVDDGLDSSAAATPANENAPALSLFNNGVLGLQRSDIPTPNITYEGSATRKLEKLRRELLRLLPSDSTLKRLEEVSGSWWLIKAQCFQEYDGSLLSGVATAYSDSHPTAVAKALLWVSICLQQLPRGFDANSLDLPYSPTKLVAECVRIVADSISPDETLVSSIDGLECLVLQGVLDNNDGKLRDAWLSYRRALNVAQVIGLHRLVPESTNDSASVARARRVWCHIIYADRYLSLMLGMHHGISDVALDRKEKANTSQMDLLSSIAGSIIERNQRFNGTSPSMVRTTQTIDTELLSIRPSLMDEDPTTLSQGNSIERAQAYTKLMTKLWYHQLIAWLHLPLLLESVTGDRFDYSRQSCLEASRHMIACYVSIRRLTTDSFCCKSLDFQAFTAAVTLLINILGPTNRSQPNADDWPAIETVITSLATLAEGQPPDKVANQGLHVLQLLKKVATGNNPIQSDPSAADGQSGRIKVGIPYFGTFTLDCSVTRHLPEHSKSQNDLSNPVSTNPASNDMVPSDVGNVMEETTAYGQVTNAGLWPEVNIELDSTDLWLFDPDLTALPSFLPNLEDTWDLTL